jgi:hypothetical protein
MLTDILCTTRPTLPIITRTELKTHGHVDSAYDDDNFDAYLLSASMQVEVDCGRYFRSQVWTQYNTCFDSPLKLERVGFDSLTLKYYDSANSLTTISSSNYFVGKNKIFFNSTYSLPGIYNRVDAIQVAMTFGNDLLLPIAKDATRLLALDRYKNREQTTTTNARSIPNGYEYCIEKLRANIRI